MKSPETRPSYPPSGGEGEADLPDITSGENLPSEQLSDDELAKRAKDLIPDIRNALLKDSSYVQAAATLVFSLETLSDRIPTVSFMRAAIPYFARWSETPSRIDIHISRFPEGRIGTRREHIEVVWQRVGVDEEYGAIQWASMWVPGQLPEIHTNTPIAIERVQAFVKDLQQAS